MSYFMKGLIPLENEDFLSTYKNIGLKVLYYRKLQGLTQKELAQKTGLSSAQISSIECGKGSCKVNALFCIANALSINITKLF